MSAPELWKSSVLKSLPVRRDPHWGPPLARGRHVGYRKLDAERGTWIARLRGTDGKMRFQALGDATPTFQWHQAKAAAEEWFTTQGDTISVVAGAPLGRAFTVTDACRELVTVRREEYEADLKARGVEPFKTDKPAWKNAQYHFSAHVYDKPFGAKSLATLTASDIETWRAGLQCTKATQNRITVSFRAAFNLAVKKQRIPASRAIEMRKVTQHFIGETTRKVPYLDLAQRRDFLAACGESESDFHDLVKAHILTGARPGEIVKLRRRQFEPRTKSVTFIGKTRRKTTPRTVPLTNEALALFSRRALRAPKPDDLLFTNAGKLWQHDGDGWSDRVYGAAREARSPEGTTLACFRHAWITDALVAGMSALQVSKLVGTSLAMIEKHYGHLVVSRARDELNAVQFC